MKTLFLAAVFLIFGGPNFSHASDEGVIRYAKGIVTIQRGYYEKVGDTYVSKNEEVCKKEVAIPVTDTRAIQKNNSVSVSCDSVLEGKNVSASVGIGINILNFTTDQTVTLKSVSSILSVYEKGTILNPAQKQLTASFATEKLDLESMWMYLFAFPEITCKVDDSGRPVCDAPRKDTMSAYVRIEDKQ